jgi:hypothetical protein
MVAESLIATRNFPYRPRRLENGSIGMQLRAIGYPGSLIRRKCLRRMLDAIN